LHTQFEGWSEEARDERLLEFAEVIAKCAGKGVAFVVDNKCFSLIKDLEDDDGNYFVQPLFRRFDEYLNPSSVLTNFRREQSRYRF
jgi:hypothetical protein